MKGSKRGAAGAAAAAAAAVTLPTSGFRKVLDKGPGAKQRKLFKLSKVRLFTLLNVLLSKTLFCSVLLCSSPLHLLKVLYW